MAHAFRTAVSLVCVLALLAPAVSTGPAQAELSRSAYVECAARDEAGLESALARISEDALKFGIGKVDYQALVGRAWDSHNLDEIIDKRVDIAVEEVKAETSWAERLKSLTNSEAAQKLATSVAEGVYWSDAVKAALEALAQDVAREVGRSIETATGEAASPVLDCLKAFIGPRYGSAVADAVAGDAGRNVAIDPAKGEAEPSAGSVLKETSGGIAGATLLIVRRQLANLATRVGQRIVGSVLSRLVSVAAGGIGLVLIAKDIWDFRHGVLPIIAAEMKAPATKDKVREEIAATISEQIGDHVKEIAQTSARHILEIWREFKRAHAIVLKLADADGDFRSFLETVSPARMSRLDEVVAIIAASEGEPAISRRLADGTLNEAVHQLPDAALQIARETRSLGEALGWRAVAGEQLGAVVEYDIHRRAKPSGFTKVSLSRVLAMEERTSIMRLAAVPASARDVLFSLQGNDLKVLARNLSEAELTTLASYLDGLREGPREQVLRAVASSPSRMQILARERVRDAIISSSDQAAAVTMMLETPPAFSPRIFARDVQLAADGQIEPILLWDKHPIGVALSGGLALILLTWFMRLFRRPRRALLAGSTGKDPSSGAPPPADQP